MTTFMTTFMALPTQIDSEGLRDYPESSLVAVPQPRSHPKGAHLNNSAGERIQGLIEPLGLKGTHHDAHSHQSPVIKSMGVGQVQGQPQEGEHRGFVS